MRDLHELPKFRDGMSYLYVERCKIEQDHHAIALSDKVGKVQVPCASLAVLMMGPGTSITHAAIKTLSKDGCLVVWCGEEGIRFYASGMGKTRSAKNTLRQARLATDSSLRLQVVKNMYTMRFQENVDDILTIQQLRGREGARVRKAYAKASRESGVEWHGRKYNRSNWNSSDPINRAISAANACLYGICHAAIVITGFSPAIGFIHTGKMLSFVYDIADLYKADITIPISFQIVKDSDKNIASRTRVSCRNKFLETKLLQNIIPDIEKSLDVKEKIKNSDNDVFFDEEYLDFNTNGALPGNLWDPDSKSVRGGKNFDPEDNY